MNPTAATHPVRETAPPLASPADWQQIFALLDTALDLDAAAQPRWLDTLPPEQAHLSPLLKNLLQAHAQVSTGDFLQSPPTFAFDDTPARFSLAADALVGPYRLLREIGQGGMASVWLAERADGLLERRIALKLPHLSWGAAAFADRMARERNILGALTHPNIARLYDAGIADDGRPFLALEYVDGEPIDTYAKAHGLSVRARVELIVQVARAVAHAHARLVVHRDLKPSNILVDAASQAHLLDFGIAKLIDPLHGDDAAQATQATQVQGRALTPDYASPEQIRGDAIGTASDIYSLGIVMFELLAGERPYRLKRGLGPVALVEAIEQAEVPRASTAAADAALQRQLSGDLDAIVARTLAKVSAERYATIDALADDLERHLRGEPVQARPDSRWYRAERWVRRHKLETAIAAAVLLALLGGAYAQVLVLVALGAGATVALWQRNRALQQAERARSALDRAEQVKDFIGSIFTHAVPRAGKGGAVTAADLLQAASRRVETDLMNQPEVAAELGALIGASFNELGELRAGLDWLPKVVERCTRALGPRHRLTLQSRWRLAEAANTLGQLAVSEPLLPALVTDLRAAQPPEPQLLVGALCSQAFVHTKRAREAQAMAALNEAVEIAAARFGEASDITLGARAALSNTFTHFGRKREALQAIEPALAPVRSAYGSQRPHTVLAMIERCHADALARHDRPRDAAKMLRQVLVDQRALDVEETTRVRTVMNTLAYALQLGGQVDQAELLLEQADVLHRRLTGGVNHEAVQLAGGRCRNATLRGDGDAALRHLAHAATLAAELGGSAAYAVEHAAARALAQAVSGQHASALAGADAMLLQPAALSATARAGLLRVRVMALRELGSVALACEAAEQALAAAQAGEPSGLGHGLVWAEAARCSLAAGEPAKAIEQFRSALARWDAGQVDGAELIQPVRAELEALLALR
jgi:eukaryotic-like serine/threonine-protein kinase